MRFNKSDCELELEGPESQRDYILLSGGYYLLSEIQAGFGSGKGKNSCVFRASPTERDENADDVIVKFCRFPKDVEGDEETRRRWRFVREIEALKKATDAKLGEFLVTYYENGEFKVDADTFTYYVMEKAECDLTDYLASTTLTLQQKMLLCSSILRDLKALHELGIYHRDLKPDNIFVVNGQWKIGDLGFIRFRDEDESIDIPRERIGPTGLMSPEATNKAFSNFDLQEFEHDCQIDALSDIYQLGGVFWYIFQGNFPTGQLILGDFKIGNTDIFSRILFPMLQYGKARRPTINSLSSHFRDLNNEFVL